MRKGLLLKNIAFVFSVVFVCCLFVVIITMLKLPDIYEGNKAMGSFQTRKFGEVAKDVRLGKFGEMMIKMLPEDLAFTVFVPLDRAFERDLSLRVNDSFVGAKINDTYTVVSRILGFSAVPRSIYSANVAVDEGVSCDSLSGFTLYISKDIDGMLVVNRIRSKKVDLKKGDIVVHIIDGVIMDAEFEQSVQPDEED